jgi:hypothetical protein
MLLPTGFLMYEKRLPSGSLFFTLSINIESLSGIWNPFSLVWAYPNKNIFYIFTPKIRNNTIFATKTKLHITKIMR